MNEGGQAVSSAYGDIVRLTHDYAMYNDTFRVAELVELFTPDAWFDMRPAGLRQYDGRAAIGEFFEKEKRALSHVFHLTANHRVDVAPDGESATGTAYFHAVGVVRRTGAQNSVHGYYEDEYVRTPEGWRFASRSSNPLIPWQPVTREGAA